MKYRSVFASLPAVALSLAFSANAEAQQATEDPLGPINMKIHAFNDYMDKHLLRPVAVGYRRYMPNPIRVGVDNFFSNIGDIGIFANNILQGKFGDAASDTGRIVINTTIGIGGVLDLASKAGLSKHNEDFGQTLGAWGVQSGPYIVLPFFGPSTLRDAFGLAVDTTTNPLNYQDNVRLRNSAFVLEQINRRGAALVGESLLMGDPYIFMREAYLQQRAYDVSDGEAEEEEWDDGWEGWD
jgi:phospholipid-binding lipoprotein MlaA